MATRPDKQQTSREGGRGSKVVAIVESQSTYGFKYQELVVSRGSHVVAHGRVSEVERHRSAGDGYRSSTLQTQAVLVAPPDSELRLRTHTADEVESARKAVRRALALGIALGAWAVGVFFMPSIFK